jgi:PiT family inorganic phosphate transporter
MTGLVLFVIFLALVFDFVNGVNDAANSIATVVTTRVLSPTVAVFWAAFFNFAAAFGFGVAVAKTIGKGMIDVSTVDTWVVLAGLVGAIAWGAATTLVGLPISISHALIGGYAGAAVMKGGFGVIVLSGWIKTLLFIVLAPVIGLVLGFLLMTGALRLLRGAAPAPVDKLFRRLQLVSAAAYSLGHGTNDAQKTMGIISSLLFAAGYLKEFTIPFWVVILCHSVIALGTLAGGWRVVKTMGQKITKLRPVGGFCAETAGAVTLLGTPLAGIPVSTTHTITGAIMGVGTTHRLSAVRWGVANRIVWAWVLTIPASAAMAAATYLLLPVGGN